jgi:hypothetical protein
VTTGDTDGADIHLRKSQSRFLGVLGIIDFYTGKPHGFFHIGRYQIT